MGDIINFAPRAKTIAKPKSSMFQRMIGKRPQPDNADQNKTELPSDCEPNGAA